MRWGDALSRRSPATPGSPLLGSSSARPASLRSLRGWHLVTPVVFALAGVLLATSAHISRGTDLRAGSRTDLPELIGAQQQRLAQRTAVVARLRSDVGALTRTSGEDELSAVQRDVDVAARAVGLQAEHGAGLRVTLADSPYRLGDPQLPSQTGPDDLVVHQQDLQAVVNALWRGGATAVGVMDQRLISTSAVRCAGNVLILQGRTYAPPFVVTAIGAPRGLQAALRKEPGVKIFAQYADVVGLRYDVVEKPDLDVPAYDGPLSLIHAHVPPAATPTATSRTSGAPASAAAGSGS